MTFRQARPDTAAIGAFGVVFAMLAGGQVALASSGVETLCDRSVTTQRSLDVTTQQLNIEVVDHGAANSVAAGTSALNAPLRERPGLSDPANIRPRVEVILRRIFDEPQLRTPEVQAPQDSDARSTPLTVDQSDEVDETATTIEPDNQSEVTTRLPGVSNDELIRFKKQMYRTDI